MAETKDCPNCGHKDVPRMRLTREELIHNYELMKALKEGAHAHPWMSGFLAAVAVGDYFRVIQLHFCPKCWHPFR